MDEGSGQMFKPPANFFAVCGKFSACTMGYVTNFFAVCGKFSACTMGYVTLYLCTRLVTARPQ